jgi:hypothetical protein
MGRRVDVGNALEEIVMVGRGIDVGNGLGEILLDGDGAEVRIVATSKGAKAVSVGNSSSIGAQADRMATMEINTRSQKLRDGIFIDEMSSPPLRISSYI